MTASTQQHPRLAVLLSYVCAVGVGLPPTRVVSFPVRLGSVAVRFLEVVRDEVVSLELAAALCSCATWTVLGGLLVFPGVWDLASVLCGSLDSLRWPGLADGLRLFVI